MGRAVAQAGGYRFPLHPPARTARCNSKFTGMIQAMLCKDSEFAAMKSRKPQVCQCQCPSVMAHVIVTLIRVPAEVA
eukprot:77377-Rhodomonas_salina.2